MPHVSRHSLNPEIEKELTHTLDVILAKLAKSEDIDKFLLSLLTPTERIMLAKRIAIIVLLNEGLPESHIADTLHVTRITVSRLRFFFEARGEGYKLALTILENEKLMQDIKTSLLKLAEYAANAAGGRVRLKSRIH